MLTVLAPFLLTPLPAVAATDGEAGGERIDEVVVTAMRRPVATEDFAYSLSSISSDGVLAHKLVTDAVGAAAGVAIQQTTPGQGAAIVRGQKGSAVLHLVDGFRLNNAIFRNAPTQYLALVPGYPVERMEVLKGTPASLYGSDATGGVVQVITRRPNFDAADASIRGSAFASADTAESALRFGATIDAGTKRAFSSFSIDLIDVGDRETGGGRTIAPTGYESRAARALFGIKPDDDSTISIDVQFLEQPETPRVDELVPGFGQTAPSSSEFFFRPNRRSFVHGKYEVENGWLGLAWTVDAGWQRIDDDRVSRDFQSPTRVFEQNSSDLYGVLGSAGHVDASSSWIVGAEVYYDVVGSRRQNLDMPGGQSTSAQARFPDDSSVSQFGVYGNGAWHLSDRHSLSGGLRASFVRTDVSGTATTSAAELNNSDLSGDIGWVARLGSNWQLTGNVGFGFRAPNIFDVGTLGNRPGNRFNVPNTALESEHVVQGEIGVRFRNDDARFAAVVFAATYSDRITSVLTGAITPDGRDVIQSVNAAESDLWGFESEFSVGLADRLRLQGDLAYVWGEERVSSGMAEPADRVPPLQGSLRLHVEAREDLRISAWLRFADRQNRLSSRDRRDVRINPAGTPGWSALGASAAWQLDSSWQLSIALENALDTGYRLHGSGIDATGRNLVFAIHRYWR